MTPLPLLVALCFGGALAFACGGVVLQMYGKAAQAYVEEAQAENPAPPLGEYLYVCDRYGAYREELHVPPGTRIEALLESLERQGAAMLEKERTEHRRAA